MLTRIFCDCLLRPEDVPPSRDDFEVVGVFNPGALAWGADTVLLLRVAERPKSRRPGFLALPRYSRGDVVLDWVRECDVQVEDPRVVRDKATGQVRLTFVSHLRVARSRNGRVIDRLEDVRFLPETEEEEYGVEDARMVLLNGACYFTYVAVSRHGAATALASTRDFRQFTRHGIVFPPENKDILLFPELLDQQYLAYHRPNPAYRFSPPAMWIASSPDLMHWGRHAPLHAGAQPWESARIGGGAPPIRTPAGWLEIYHGNAAPAQPGAAGAYVAAAFMADLDDPGKILGQTREPILAPERDFERRGFLPDIVFPTGAVLQNDILQVFYGAADAHVGVVEFSIGDLLHAVQPLP